jgi:nucleoid-associated protein YgaU
MGCVQQAVLEFDEEVRSPWRPRLVPDTGGDLARVRPPSHRTGSRAAPRTPPGPRRECGPARRPDAGHPLRAGRPARPVRGRALPTLPAGRVRLRLTRRARRLAFVLAVAGGIAVGLWLAPLLAGGGQLRLAGESTVVVQQGDTLWSIATTVAGGGADVRAVVDEIQRLNGLHGSELVPGQVLDLP